MGLHSRLVEFILRSRWPGVVQSFGLAASAAPSRECTFREESATTGSRTVISPWGR